MMKIDPTKWTAVDGLGRTVDCNAQTGDSAGKQDKLVGMFYWTWHDTVYKDHKPINITSVMKEHPQIQNDYNNPIWDNYKGFYFWNEPLYGYYARTDKYVLRKHAEMLANAGIDFILFDCTNADAVWEYAYTALLEVWSDAKAQGVQVPKVAFMMQFSFSKDTVSSLTKVYNRLYKPGLYKDMWFCLEGKPMVMSHSKQLDESDPLQKEIKEFFTFKEGIPSYFEGDKTDKEWGWLHIYPQALYKDDEGKVVMTTVGVAQNADYKEQRLCAMNGPANMGRSYTGQPDYSYSYEYRGEKIVVNRDIENSMFYGLNFQEQWDYAISVDPQIIFVTGWNEWNMGRFKEWCGIENAFPDQFDDENSRDIEPSKGILKDYYYYQLVSNVRRFKGSSAQECQKMAKTIDITKGKDQWNDERIIAFDYYSNNTYKRDTDGYVGYHYTSDATRNDIITAKVSYDDDNVYFYVETKNNLTSYTDKNWMRLLLDTQPAGKATRDWEEFEYIFNRNNPTDKLITVEKSLGGWNWEEVGKVSYSVTGNILQLEVPREMINMKDRIAFNFKWCDNNLSDGDITELYTEGSCVPGGRFTFSFIGK
ncbi:MAG: hypothetical protein IKJ75_04820 [Clostridia bacterium]|nr:hypothetical protein [Clostridia bacterium]